MIRQDMDWGYIKWIHTADEYNNGQSMNIGITVTLPGKYQKKHMHYGHEQVQYVLEGEGYYIISGKKRPLKKGSIVYIPEGASHETYNTGTVPIQELIVSNTVNYDSALKVSLQNADKTITAATADNALLSSVSALRSQLLNSIKIPFAIFDKNWSLVIQNDFYPPFCVKHCDPQSNKKCECMCQLDNRTTDDCDYCQATCDKGIAFYQYPIIYKNEYIGTIVGGHILASPLQSIAEEDLFDTTKNTLSGVHRIFGTHRILRQIKKSILSYCDFIASKKELRDKELIIAQTEHTNELLEQDLYTVKDEVTNLKISHHFLFNTLNSMANMALSGDREDLYNSIIDLSKMFRYTMTSDQRFIDLKSELNYLDNYLNLQKLRYGSSLSVSYEINPSEESAIVPFNFIQPIVENAFTHGFRNEKQKTVRVKAAEKNGYLEIFIYNNGPSLSEDDLDKIQKSLRTNKGHGLYLINKKLESAYHDDFLFQFDYNEKEGTIAHIKIPVKRR